MGIKMPQISSCCFCLPLRTGLLTLGYINLIYHSLICIMVVFLAFSTTIMSMGMAKKFPPLEWVLLFPLVTISDVIFYILVVVATHKKDARLLKPAFIVGTALWIFTVLYSIFITYQLGTDLLSTSNQKDHIKFGIYVTAIILELSLHAYVVLLVWSLKSMIRAETGETQALQYSELDKINKEAKADCERLCE